MSFSNSLDVILKEVDRFETHKANQEDEIEKIKEEMVAKITEAKKQFAEQKKEIDQRFEISSPFSECDAKKLKDLQRFTSLLKQGKHIICVLDREPAFLHEFVIHDLEAENLDTESKAKKSKLYESSVFKKLLNPEEYDAMKTCWKKIFEKSISITVKLYGTRDERDDTIDLPAYELEEFNGGKKLQELPFSNKDEEWFDDVQSPEWKEFILSRADDFEDWDYEWGDSYHRTIVKLDAGIFYAQPEDYFYKTSSC